MKCFLYIFYAFFMFLGVINSSFSAQNSFFSLKEIVKDFDSASLVLSKKVGEGELITTDFGSLQLFCADSGSDNLTYAKFALSATISPKSTLKNPTLTLIGSKNVKKDSFFYPVARPLNPQAGLTYQIKAAFPFWVEIEQSGKPVSLTVSFSALWCKEEICKPVTQKTSFTLGAGKNYFSAYTDFVLRSFDFVPMEATPAQLTAHSLNNDSFWIKLNIPDKITDVPIFVLLNNENQPILYTLKYSRIEKNQGLFVLKLDENIKNFRVLVQTDFAVWAQNLNLTPKEIPQILVDSQSVRHFPICLWIFFLCFSPAIVLLFELNFKNEVFVRPKIILYSLQIGLGILSGILIYSVWPYNYLAQSKLWLCFCSILFTFLVLSKKKLLPFTSGVLTAIVPYFAFCKGLEIPVPENLLDLSVFFVKLALLNILPFALLFIKPIWAVRLKIASDQMQPYVKKYPLYMDLVLFVYLTLMLYFVQ